MRVLALAVLLALVAAGCSGNQACTYDTDCQGFALCIQGRCTSSDDEMSHGDSDSCAGISCSGHGQCHPIGGAPTCVCETGYHPSGHECILDGGDDGSDAGPDNGNDGADSGLMEPTDGADGLQDGNGDGGRDAGGDAHPRGDPLKDGPDGNSDDGDGS